MFRWHGRRTEPVGRGPGSDLSAQTPNSLLSARSPVRSDRANTPKIRRSRAPVVREGWRAVLIYNSKDLPMGRSTYNEWLELCGELLVILAFCQSIPLLLQL